MSIIESIFSYGTSVCICCNNKRLLKNMAINCTHTGICKECIKTVKETKGEGAFEGREFVSYLIAPLYYNGKMRNLIKNLKFCGEFKSAEVIHEIFKGLPDEAPHLLDFDMVIPVPLSRQRSNERGYNQAELIAKGVADVLCLPLYANALNKIKNTDRQSNMSKIERLKNVRDAFCVNDDVKNKRIILVDDVYTTGNTLNSCAKELIKSGAEEVVGICSAVTVKDNKYF